MRYGNGFKDLTDKQFNHWTVIRIIGKRNGAVFWLCRCVCGHEREISSGPLRQGKPLSCGCKRGTHRLTVKRNGKYRLPPLYAIWAQMIQRCHNPKNAAAKNYLERGIIVCDRWRYSFENFYADMGERTSPKHSLERINNDGNYEPENCKWATKIEQTNNTRQNRILEYRGVKYNTTQLATFTGVPYKRLEYRLRCGWSVEKAVNEPVDLSKVRNKKS